MTDSIDNGVPEPPTCARCGSPETSVAFATAQMTYHRCHACGHLWNVDREREPQQGRRRTDVP